MIDRNMITAPNLAGLKGLIHGFGLRSSTYPPEIVTAKQVHSSIVQDAAGALGLGDALISKEPDVLVGVRTADCVPILLADPVTGAVAAIHAGWRGSAAGISSAAVSALSERWNVRPEDLRAAIGPSIGLCCYEVGPEVAYQFQMDVSKSVHLDLPAVNEKQLRDAGVTDIWVSGECTFCAKDRFYSFRRDREQAGRMTSFIGWPKRS